MCGAMGVGTRFKVFNYMNGMLALSVPMISRHTRRRAIRVSISAFGVSSDDDGAK